MYELVGEYCSCFFSPGGYVNLRTVGNKPDTSSYIKNGEWHLDKVIQDRYFLDVAISPDDIYPVVYLEVSSIVLQVKRNTRA